MFCLLQAGIRGEEEMVHDSKPDAPEGGVRFGVYEIDCHADGSLCELGRGAMGVTYRATDTSLQRKVALKIIKTDIAERSADARERFVREARAAAALRHEHIATVYQFGMRLETGQYFYAMELIEGETLDDRVRRSGPLDARTTIGIAEQVTSALAAAEKHGLVHRDLKPANLMLVNADDPDVADGDQARSKRSKMRALRKSRIPVVKIIDFGLAKAFQRATDPNSLTHDKFVGTPVFASPEQFEHSALDVRSDIYSLGETLWFALTGKAPFAGRTLSEIHLAQKSNALPVEQLKAAHVQHRLKSLIESMLAFEPASRPGTHELAARLKGCSPETRSVRRSRIGLAAAFILILGATGFFALRSTRPQNLGFNPPAPDKSIAVLPFENRSEDKANAYFAEGIQDEILTRLSKIADLKVISRTSTQHYKSAPENLREIARELGVAHIVEGSVQKSGDAVRVNVQLINAATDSHVWADTFDRKLTDIFSVESEISQEIAEALQANLSPSESHILAAVRAPDTEAYDLFLRGEYEFRQAESSPAAEVYDRAESFYRQALARDPNFAEAAAALARSRLLRRWFFSPFSPAELDEVKSLIDRALALAPNSPEAHLALGLFFYFAHRQYEMALAEFHRALELQPNNALVRLYCARVYRRRGEWERSLAYFRRAQELDPRDALICADLGSTYSALRQWKDAERAGLRALAIDPQNAWAPVDLLLTRLSATGDVESAQRALNSFPERIKSFTRTTGGGGEAVGLIGIWAYLDMTQRRFTDAFQAFEKNVDDDDSAHLRQLAGRVTLRVIAGQTEAAKSAAKEALPLFEATLKEQPDNTLAMMGLSWVYCALGRNGDALRLSRQAADSMPIEKDAVTGPSFQVGLAEIEASAGAPEQAIKRIRHLLSIPAGMDLSISRLKIDPVWDPIRTRPDFQQLLSGPEQIGPNK
jgi:serine/threonine protein kinase/Flp pilus assembly protein TadD